MTSGGLGEGNNQMHRLSFTNPPEETIAGENTNSVHIALEDVSAEFGVVLSQRKDTHLYDNKFRCNRQRRQRMHSTML